MQRPPTLTIITVCYNAVRYLPRTVESVMAQTWPAIEYIIIDGASTDGTVDLIEALAQRYPGRISRWLSEKDRNHYDAMNKGLVLATGDYINFMNAGDCFYGPDSAAQAMRLAPAADFIYGGAVVVTETGQPRPWHKPTPHALRPHHLAQGMVVCHHSLYVARALAQATPYRLQWRISADLDWTLRLLRGTRRVAYTGTPLCRYLDGGISTDNKWRAVRERMAIAAEHLGWPRMLWGQLLALLQLVRRRRLT